MSPQFTSLLTLPIERMQFMQPMQSFCPTFFQRPSSVATASNPMRGIAHALSLAERKHLPLSEPCGTVSRPQVTTGTALQSVFSLLGENDCSKNL